VCHLHLEQRLERSAVRGRRLADLYFFACALLDIFRSVGRSGKIVLLGEVGEEATAGLFGVASLRHPAARRRLT
jgi:hypothetical protein